MGINLEKLLTIGIPTYNRKSTLKKQLENLYRLNTISDDVEVLVSDNFSEDGTVDMLKEFKKSHDNFKFHVNEKNLGYDGNIYQIYGKAEGKYIWFLSDDDLLVEKALDYVVEKIKSLEDCGIIIVPQVEKNQMNIKEENDIIPYNPMGEKIKILIGNRGKVDKEKLRLNLLLLASQVSSCIVIRGIELREAGEGGGLMHSKLANLNLLQMPYYFILDKGLVVPGVKENISNWFMESTLFGIRKLYTSKEMKFSKEVSDLVSTQTCNFGLILMQQRYAYLKSYFRYKEIDEKLIDDLKNTYGDSFFKLEENIEKALKKKKLKYIYKYFLFPLGNLSKLFKLMINKLRRI